MLTDGPNNKASILTQNIDPKFIRTMKSDISTPIASTSHDASVSTENPFTARDVSSDKTLAEGIPDSQIVAQRPIIQEFSDNISTINAQQESISAHVSDNTDERNPFNAHVPETPILPQKEDILPIYPIKGTPPTRDAVDQKTDSIPQSKIQTSTESSGEKILVAIILVLIIISLIGGGYYYWATKRYLSEQDPQISATDEASNETLPQQQPKNENPITIDPISEKYSQEKPNLLTINTNTLTPQDIKKLFVEIGNEVKKINPSKLLEFILVDENNNPIAFSRFVTMAKIDLPTTLVSNFDEKFSLFYYLDNGFVKTGLQIDSKSKIATTSEMKTAEKNIIPALDILYLENKYSPQSPVFNNSTYKSFPIRYFNINPETLTSFDYTTTENYLIIGTSKETLRNILENKQL